VDINSRGEITLLFPNQYHSEHHIQANTTYRIPDDSYGFSFQVQPPFGRDRIYAIASDGPIDIFNTPGVPWWLKFPIPLIPVIEFSSLFIKHIVLVIRLFANIVAGHIVALGFFALIFIFGEMNILAGYGISVVTIAFTIFLTLLELLVAFIQAYVFTLLSALYIGLALEEGH
jgi:F0F1-type ATP synthase membrane subunit a